MAQEKNSKEKTREGEDWNELPYASGMIHILKARRVLHMKTFLTCQAFFVHKKNMSSIFMKIRETCNVLNQRIIELSLLTTREVKESNPHQTLRFQKGAHNHQCTHAPPGTYDSVSNVCERDCQRQDLLKMSKNKPQVSARISTQV